MRKGILAGLAFGVAFSISCGTSQGKSEERAANFAKNAEFTGVSKITCQQYDSDSNGYVTCTLFMKDGKDPYVLECPAWSNSNACLGDGECRPASVKVTR